MSDEMRDKIIMLYGLGETIDGIAEYTGEAIGHIRYVDSCTIRNRDYRHSLYAKHLQGRTVSSVEAAT